ncbi:hypothetical protein CE91St44_23610 [Oscillospiraceae bacterium]|nr:hypothetical protein CE91St44_23610 [Oscillospiraceae bacterium]
MKKIIITLLSLALCLSFFTFSTFADDATLQPRYVPICGKYAAHDMLSHGWGWARNSSGKTILNGNCFQCTRCHHVMICEGEPTIGGIIGNYSVSDEYSETISNMTEIASDNVYYCNSSSLDGYKFRDILTG